MKTTLLVLCLLFTSAAFAQYYGGPGHIESQPTVYQPPDHPAHASYAPMMQEQTVLGSNYSSAQGERRASDFPQAEGISLGIYARELRKQHDQMKKARFVWVNQ